MSTVSNLVSKKPEIRRAKLIERNSFESKAHMTVITWIKGWYNPMRRRSGLG